jgi:hypothetical protein
LSSESKCAVFYALRTAQDETRIRTSIGPWLSRVEVAHPLSESTSCVSLRPISCLDKAAAGSRPRKNRFALVAPGAIARPSSASPMPRRASWLRSCGFGIGTIREQADCRFVHLRRNAIGRRPYFSITNNGRVKCRLLGSAAEVYPAVMPSSGGSFRIAQRISDSCRPCRTTSKGAASVK